MDMQGMSRRDMFRVLAGGFGASLLTDPAPALSVEKDGRTGLGIVIYCLNIRQEVQRKRQPGSDLFDPLTFIDYCHGLGAGGVQVSLGIRSDDYTHRLRQKAEDFRMFIEGIVSPPRDTADLDRFEAELRTASRAGVRAARTVIIPGRRYETFDSREEFRESAERGQKSLELAEPVAARHRVRLAVENHKDQRVPERLALLRHLSSEWVGACVDTGNSLALLEDPVAVVEAFAPWAASVHLKDQAVSEYEHGFLLADIPLGKGFLDLKKMVEILRKANPNVMFSLELITRDPLKVPCLTEKYWATFGDVPGRDLARTLRMVRANAARDLPRVNHLPLNQQAAVEEENIRSSLVFAGNTLFL